MAFPFALALLAGAAVHAASTGHDALTPAALRAKDAVRAEGIRAHVRFLADDLLEGRDTGSTGGAIAARYLAAQAEQLGLKPAGDRGAYYQRLGLVKTQPDTEHAAFTLTGPAGDTAWRWGADYLPFGGTRGSIHIDAPLVFVGYGITAPEYQYDDYTGLDAKNKVVVLLPGQPPSKDPSFFQGGKPTPYLQAATKVENARKHGAVGVISILTGGRRSGWMQLQALAGNARLALDDPAAPAPFNLIATAESGAKLFQGAPASLEDVRKQADEGKLKGFELPLKAKINLPFIKTPVEAYNVAGLVEGGDPRLKDEVVIFSAHYDHVGTRTGEGDRIFNGAWDNASGSAGLLEVARAFAAMRPAPRRSILFLWVSGEEKGLLGSKYYVQHPLLPLEKTAADVNMDMTDIFGVARDITPLGAEHSSLMHACEVVAKELGVKVGPDPVPSQRAFTRSDQASFAAAGIPSLFLRWGNEYDGLDAETAKKRSEEKLAAIYHKVTDEFDPAWSWEGMRRHAQAAFLIGAYVADQDEMPRWNDGDPFNKPRQAPLAP